MSADGPAPYQAGEPLPPHSTAAERALLGACITDPINVLPVASTFLEARDFYHPQNGEIFTALCSFDGRGTPDFTLLCDELEHRGALQRVGGISYLTTLIQAGALALQIEEYCQAIYTTSFKRALIQTNGRIARLAYEAESGVPEIMDRVFDEFERVRQRFAVRPRPKPTAPTQKSGAHAIWYTQPR